MEQGSRRNVRACALLTGAAILALVTPRHAPALVWNASASAPVGLYRVTSYDNRRGALVIAMPPRSLRLFAAARGYLPIHVPLVKYVAGLSGDRICSVDHRITINGRAEAMRLSADSHDRPLPSWQGCRTLQPNEAFLLNAGVKNSFDGRYFGPVDRAIIVGRLSPLWTR